MTRTDLVTEVVEAVAEADGMDPAEVDPLYDHIDPEVLYKLADQERGKWSLTFRYSDHQITVTHESRILVDGVSYTSESSVR